MPSMVTGTSQIITVSSTLGLVEHILQCSLRLVPIITVSSTLGLVEHLFESVLVHAVQCMCGTDLYVITSHLLCMS